MKHELKSLEYSYDALEPYIDKETMEIHHSKHHKGYVDKLNLAIEKFSGAGEKSVEEILENLNSIPEEIRRGIINNAGGVYNHDFFWSILKKEVEPTGKIIEEIKKKFGSFNGFKKELSNAAATIFGSGWAWLVLDEGELEIVQTKNQDSPISTKKIPLI